MQDRFRVRVWNKKEKEMIYNAEFAYDGMNYNLEGELIGPNRNDGHICCLAEYLNDSNYESMQCTGLKDKNGKLIYEGDIIRVQYIGAQIPLFSRQFSNLPKDEIFAIIYDHDWHKFRCENPNYKKTCEIHSLDLDAIQINTENKQYEIIGNIYQNLELIEEQEQQCT